MRRFRAAAMALLGSLIFTPEISIAAERVEKPQPPGCEIKGNVSRTGKLYYLPEHPLYGRVLINKSAEQWFCSEDQAVGAGWRPAGSFRPGLPVHDAEDSKRPEDVPEHLGCVQPIKGNITTERDGRRIKRYHEFGSPRYAETVVRPGNGDQYSCTVAEAEAAGFEKAGTFLGHSGHDQRDCEVPTDIPNDARQRRAFIKGNISDAGRIYHELGTQHYAETQITMQRGEQWFVSKEEARAAGWRAPLNGGKKLTCGFAQVGLR